jgi:hypothetical protein
MHWKWRVRLTVLVGLAGLQLWPSDSQTNPPETGLAPMPPDIRLWAEPLCFDCHSHRTYFPWYSRVAPISWWIGDEVKRGRAGLNFSRWPEYTPRQQIMAWRRSLQRIQEQRMPPALYSWRHPVRLSEQDIRRLENYVQELARSSAELSGPELLAWPSRQMPGNPTALRGVFRASGIIRDPLVLNGAMVLADGDLHLQGGVSGTGAILAVGTLSIDHQSGAAGPMALVSLGEIRLRGDGRLTALLQSQGGVNVQGVSWTPMAEFEWAVPQVRENRLEFCRDDGEMGERIERQVVVRYARGRFVLWDPEFQLVREATGVEAALRQAEVLLAAEPATSLPRWRRRFRGQWRARLEQLEREGEPAKLRLRLAESRQELPSTGRGFGESLPGGLEALLHFGIGIQ